MDSAQMTVALLTAVGFVLRALAYLIRAVRGRARRLAGR